MLISIVLPASSAYADVYVQTLSIFCGLGMHNCQLHKNTERLLVQYAVNHDTLLFVSSPDPLEVDELFVRVHR